MRRGAMRKGVVVIELKDVSVVYAGGVTALHPTSVRVRRGEFTVLLGASGAGKSTLLRTLNFLTPPSTGTVTVADLGMLRRGRILQAHRRATGMIFQQHQLIGRLSALANVLLGRVGHYPAWRTLFPLPRAERHLALECLERVGLLSRALERVDRLSGGQQQRVGIARALAQRPRLMLADEPVASLDPATSERVLTQLKRIGAEDGITTIVSLHQVELARAFADRVIGLAHGRVVFDGAAEELSASVLRSIYDHAAPAVATAPDSVSPPALPVELATVED